MSLSTLGQTSRGILPHYHHDGDKEVVFESEDVENDAAESDVFKSGTEVTAIMVIIAPSRPDVD